MQSSQPKAPAAIPSSRPKWSRSGGPSQTISPAVPITPPGLTGNTNSVDGVALNHPEGNDLDSSFAARYGLLAAATAFHDPLPAPYLTPFIPAMILETNTNVWPWDSMPRPLLKPDGAANGFSVMTLPSPAPSERLIISEFRFRGPGGVADEYIQLTNITGQSVTVSTADGTAGWALAAIGANGSISTKFVIPNGTVIGQGAHYLAANSAYSLNAYATPDRSYTGDIGDNTGVALFRTASAANFTLDNRIDAAGFNAVANSLFREGAGLTPITVGTNEYTHVRKMTTGLPQDTGDNAVDFVLTSTSAASLGGVASILGAPGPENSLSTLDRTSQMAYAVLVPGGAGYGSPSGLIAKGNAGFFMPFHPSFGPADQLLADTKVALGELMHLGARRTLYTDQAFANVVHLKYPELTAQMWPGDPNYKHYKAAKDDPNSIEWSHYWHQAVDRKCFK